MTQRRASEPDGPSYDNDTEAFQALRIFRNAFIEFCRLRLAAALGDRLDHEIQTLFSREWEVVERSARQAYESGQTSRMPVDALDHLSVGHTTNLLEKYWLYLDPEPDAPPDVSRRNRKQLTDWTRELAAIRNPVSHAPQHELPLPDALRCIDTCARVLKVLNIPEAEGLRTRWERMVSDMGARDVAPPSALDTLPSREQITTEFIGRTDQLADLWRWIGDDSRRVWALVGDGGKGKTTIAYEFSSQVRSVLDEYSLHGLLWLSAKQRRFVDGTTVPMSAADFYDLDSALDWILIALGWGRVGRKSNPEEACKHDRTIARVPHAHCCRRH